VIYPVLEFREENQTFVKVEGATWTFSFQFSNSHCTLVETGEWRPVIKETSDCPQWHTLNDTLKF
jgi:hypothetical protein